jgi:hypothetical protein
MTAKILLYFGSMIVAGWGAAHLLPLRAVVKGFGDISADNRRIVIMEWMTEGISLIFVGILVAVVTGLDSHNRIAHAVYWLSFGLLNVLSIVSLFTGFKNSFIAFKLCPFIFSGSSLLILLGSYLD